MLSYGLREQLDEKDITKQIEDDIKTQISDHYSMPASRVSRSEDGQRFIISVNDENDIVSTKKDDLDFIINFLNMSDPTKYKP